MPVFANPLPWPQSRLVGVFVPLPVPFPLAARVAAGRFVFRFVYRFVHAFPVPFPRGWRGCGGLLCGQEVHCGGRRSQCLREEAGAFRTLYGGAGVWKHCKKR